MYTIIVSLFNPPPSSPTLSSIQSNIVDVAPAKTLSGEEISDISFEKSKSLEAKNLQIIDCHSSSRNKNLEEVRSRMKGSYLFQS